MGCIPHATAGAAGLTVCPCPSLLLCGIVAVKLQNYEEAEVFFEDACCLDPSSIIAWTLSGTKPNQSDAQGIPVEPSIVPGPVLFSLLQAEG